MAGNVGQPLAPFLYTTSCMHCMTVSLAAGGMGLGTMWGEQKARQMLAAAGFDNVETKRRGRHLQQLLRRDEGLRADSPGQAQHPRQLTKQSRQTNRSMQIRD